MSAESTNSAVTAACLTFPAPGGIAIVQVRGHGAVALVARFLRTPRPIDWTVAHPEELRLCRFVDDQEELDDAVVAIHRRTDGRDVVDINLHGGPRIVQRALLALQRAGAVIVEAAEHAAGAWPARNRLEAEALDALTRARTGAVVKWLSRLPDRLADRIAEIDHLLAGQACPAARESLAALLEASTRSRIVLEGIRVVLTGAPNSGKSTLANLLAGEEHSIVSEVPGTTRDWVELPAVIRGIPVTLVDTAGMRQTADPLEEESIRRARHQLVSADLVFIVLDGSCAPPTGWAPGLESAATTPPTGVASHWVWNKSDLRLHSDHTALINQAGTAGTLVSARTGMGTEGLRNDILRRLELQEWTPDAEWLFTRRQIDLVRLACDAVSPPRPDIEKGRRYLDDLIQNNWKSPQDLPSRI